MSKLIMLEGLPASGKSTFARELSKQTNVVVHSSDELRKELFGTEEEQNKNNILFTELHKRIKEDLTKGLTVIYDATNLSRKRRTYFLSQIDDSVETEIIVIATDIKKCLSRDSHRKRKVGRRVILNMWKQFEFPLESEGWDKITIHYTHDFNSADNACNTFWCARNFEQDNPNHSLNLYDHMDKASELYLESTRGKIWLNWELYTALMFHDIGKIWTKTFKNKKGEKTDIAHYYHHHNVSAYQFMFIYSEEEYEYLYGKGYKYVVQLINYHMQQYFINSDKSERKWKKIFGEEMYQDLLIMNEFDRKAH